MPDSTACFCTFHTDSLEFELPSAWKGTVKVIFTGNYVKHVNINREGLLEGQYFYCENPMPPPHTIPVNPTPLPIPYRITPFHATRLCGKDSLGDTTVSVANLDLCTDTGTERRARWTFPLGSGDTVQIVVAIDDEGAGGSLPVRIADFLRRRYDWVRRLLVRNS